jgi:hypothetical protein
MSSSFFPIYQSGEHPLSVDSAYLPLSHETMGIVDSLTKSARRASTTSSDGGNMTASSSAEKAPEGNPDDTEVLDKEEGNLVMALISQCKLP